MIGLDMLALRYVGPENQLMKQLAADFELKHQAPIRHLYLQKLQSESDQEQ